MLWWSTEAAFICWLGWPGEGKDTAVGIDSVGYSCCYPLAWHRLFSAPSTSRIKCTTFSTTVLYPSQTLLILSSPLAGTTCSQDAPLLAPPSYIYLRHSQQPPGTTWDILSSPLVQLLTPPCWYNVQQPGHDAAAAPSSCCCSVSLLYTVQYLSGTTCSTQQLLLHLHITLFSAAPWYNLQRSAAAAAAETSRSCSTATLLYNISLCLGCEM